MERCRSGLFQRPWPPPPLPCPPRATRAEHRPQRGKSMARSSSGIGRDQDYKSVHSQLVLSKAACARTMQTVWFSGCRNAPVESKHCRTCIEATSKPRRSTKIESVAAAHEHRNETASKPRRGCVAAASRPRPTCVAEVTLDRGEKPCRRPNFSKTIVKRHGNSHKQEAP